MKTIEKFLLDFCHSDNNDNKSKPFKYKDYLVFTDGIIMAMMKEDSGYLELGSFDFNKIDPIVKAIVWDSDPLEISISKIENEILTYGEPKKIYGTIECEECNGCGSEICDCCDQEIEGKDCKHCSGKGYFYTDKIEKYEYLKNIFIGGCMFDPMYIKKIIDLSKLLKINHFLYFGHDAPCNKPKAFKAGNVDILLMPLAGN